MQSRLPRRRCLSLLCKAMDGEAPATVVIADDSPAIREAIQIAISAQEGMVVAGSCADGAEAVRLVERLRPTLALIDVHMPNGGASLAARLKAVSDRTKVVVITADDSPALAAHAISSGANAYLLKFSTSSLISRLAAVLDGHLINDAKPSQM